VILCGGGGGYKGWFHGGCGFSLVVAVVLVWLWLLCGDSDLVVVATTIVVMVAVVIVVNGHEMEGESDEKFMVRVMMKWRLEIIKWIMRLN